LSTARSGSIEPKVILDVFDPGSERRSEDTGPRGCSLNAGATPRHQLRGPSRGGNAAPCRCSRSSGRRAPRGAAPERHTGALRSSASEQAGGIDHVPTAGSIPSCTKPLQRSKETPVRHSISFRFGSIPRAPRHRADGCRFSRGRDASCDAFELRCRPPDFAGRACVRDTADRGVRDARRGNASPR